MYVLTFTVTIDVPDGSYGHYEDITRNGGVFSSRAVAEAVGQREVAKRQSNKYTYDVEEFTLDADEPFQFHWEIGRN